MSADAEHKLDRVLDRDPLLATTNINELAHELELSPEEIREHLQTAQRLRNQQRGTPATVTKVSPSVPAEASPAGAPAASSRLGAAAPAPSAATLADNAGEASPSGAAAGTPAAAGHVDDQAAPAAAAPAPDREAPAVKKPRAEPAPLPPVPEDKQQLLDEMLAQHVELQDALAKRSWLLGDAAPAQSAAAAAGSSLQVQLALQIEGQTATLTQLTDFLSASLQAGGSGGDAAAAAQLSPDAVRGMITVLARRKFFGSRDPKLDDLAAAEHAPAAAAAADDGGAAADQGLLESALKFEAWVWELQDVKQLPKPQKQAAEAYRKCRKQLHERLVATTTLVELLHTAVALAAGGAPAPSAAASAAATKKIATALAKLQKLPTLADVIAQVEQAARGEPLKRKAKSGAAAAAPADGAPPAAKIAKTSAAATAATAKAAAAAASAAAAPSQADDSAVDAAAAPAAAPADAAEPTATAPKPAAAKAPVDKAAREAEKAAREAEKERLRKEKEEEKAARDAEKAAKEAEKEKARLAKDAEKAAKEAEKAAKEAEKERQKKEKEEERAAKEAEKARKAEEAAKKKKEEEDKKKASGFGNAKALQKSANFMMSLFKVGKEPGTAGGKDGGSAGASTSAAGSMSPRSAVSSPGAPRRASAVPAAAAAAAAATDSGSKPKFAFVREWASRTPSAAIVSSMQQLDAELAPYWTTRPAAAPEPMAQGGGCADEEAAAATEPAPFGLGLTAAKAAQPPLAAGQLRQTFEGICAGWRAARGQRSRQRGVPPSWARKPNTPTDFAALAAKYYGEGFDVASIRTWRRKLLKHHDSVRPPYYGSFSRRSAVVKPRKPMAKDPELDYEVSRNMQETTCTSYNIDGALSLLFLLCCGAFFLSFPEAAGPTADDVRLKTFVPLLVTALLHSSNILVHALFRIISLTGALLLLLLLLFCPAR